MAALSLPASLYGDGRRIATRPGIGTALHVLQARELMAAGLFIGQPCLIVVRRGEKEIRAAGSTCVVAAGEAVALPGASAYDIINRADANRVYDAVSLLPDPSLIEVGPTTPIRAPFRIAAPSSELVGALERALDAVFDETVPSAVAVLRVREVMAWLAAAGGRLELPRSASVVVRTRAVIGATPDRPWSGADVGHALAMSEATLRRRLADEKTSLSALLLDVRMSTALTLIQATNKSVAEVALDVGYQSPSRFAARFRERFGFPPAAVRSDPDRIRTEIDRGRSAAAAAE